MRALEKALDNHCIHARYGAIEGIDSGLVNTNL
jgi:hypothetical protein